MFASHRFAIAVGSALVCLASTACAGQTGSGVPGGSDVIQFTIAGNALIAPDAGNLNVGIYPYPKGGAAKETLTGFSQPIGATIASSGKGARSQP